MKSGTSFEAALRQNPKLKDAAYYLGRAEMKLGNEAQAVEALKRAVSEDSDPEIIQQAWCQLGVEYRRMNRTEDSQHPMAMFQKLKDEETARQQQLLQKRREAQDANDALPPVAPSNP